MTGSKIWNATRVIWAALSGRHEQGFDKEEPVLIITRAANIYWIFAAML